MDDSGRFFWVFWGVSSMCPVSSNRLPLCSLATTLVECLNTRVGEVTAGGGGMTSVKSSFSYECVRRQLLLGWAGEEVLELFGVLEDVSSFSTAP